MSRHAEWLSLIEISGPFLAVPVLKDVFPQGFEELDGHKRKRMRQAYDEWREAWDLDDPQFSKLHKTWIVEVLARGLELDEDGAGDVLKSGDSLSDSVHVVLPEYELTLIPDYAVVDEQNDNKPLLVIKTYDAEVDLEAVSKEGGWASSPAERMVHLCRATGCRLGLVTNGERWMLVDAPIGAVTTFATWYARIWMQEPITLQAFVSLLGIRRFFLDESEQLPALVDRSLKHQDEVTDALGEQVRRAVEVLVQALDRADVDRNRDLLHDVSPAELYEAGLTVMMRLVFLLCAEERGLLLMGDERYEANYAISTLRMQLRAESEEILERRMDAWSRLLATFRAVYGGIDHENLYMPALGGSLFDPDRFPFLEGRAKGTDWKAGGAKPLPIDNRTVLLLLDAIQSFEGRTLSFRALDIEQIGYIYEGLLEHTVRRLTKDTLGLIGSQKAKNPNITLVELESAQMDSEEALLSIVETTTSRSKSAISNALDKDVDDITFGKIVTVCGGDMELAVRLKPFAHLLRTDAWGDFIVYRANSFAVTLGADRRETGTHYTPKSLTESIVATTLEPVAYVGPAKGKPREEWQLKTPAELLELKICDPAMGSGAFLVQVCRWLSERLVEAWGKAESQGKFISVDGVVLESVGDSGPMPELLDERLLVAQRLVAEKCLYGVDLNPLAVELAKLSIWLITLAKGRPFGFLDHNLRSGDSLLGLHKLEQLYCFDLHADDKTPKKLFAQEMEAAVQGALALRKQLRETPIRDIRDVQYMERLDQQARQKLEHIEHIADGMIGEALASGGNQRTLETAMDNLSAWAAPYIEGDNETGRKIIAKARKSLSIDLPVGKPPRQTFHWALEFPEVFEQGGFDGIVGNPPFVGGKRIGTILGQYYQSYLKLTVVNSKGAADLVAYFFRRSMTLLRRKAYFGLIATDTISQGDTREVGLDYLIQNGAEIYSCYTSQPWPGKAGVFVALIFISHEEWYGSKMIDGLKAENISAGLANEIYLPTPQALFENKSLISEGIKIHGNGFVLEKEEASQLIQDDDKNREVIKEYIGGEDIVNSYDYRSYRYVIDFGDLSESQARKYPRLFKIVKERVRPYRDSLKGQIHEYRFWIFWDRRVNFFEKIRSNEKLMVCSGLSKHLAITFVSPKYVVSQKAKIFALNSFSQFAVLQSSIHSSWAWNTSATRGNGLAYSNSDTFATFPFCKLTIALEALGEEYWKLRQSIMELHQEGLTQIYNRFHDPEESSDALQRLRDLHVEMDKEVVTAYGWRNLNLAHDFYETKQGVRFTISEEARREVLQRLLKLNHERYEEEVAQGLHDKKKTSTPRKKKKSSLKDDSNLDLFNF